LTGAGVVGGAAAVVGGVVGTVGGGVVGTVVGAAVVDGATTVVLVAAGTDVEDLGAAVPVGATDGAGVPTDTFTPAGLSNGQLCRLAVAFDM
jgi:hypothetical protein